LRQVGYLYYLPLGLLARAELRRVTGDYQRARTDLDEAQRLAERSGMRLHLTDCHLERARLCLARGNPTLAREHWATAKAMIEQIGYHRRDRDLEEIAQELA
jgi:ATP/maltotriose-dependent transcriptional regulator MalT